MKNITQEELKAVIHYDELTGLFTWINPSIYKPSLVGKVAGHVDFYGYVVISVNRKIYKAHRLAWLYMTGNFPKNLIDHVNGIKSDNKWVNLREATYSDNRQNIRKPKTGNTSGYLGVYWHTRDKKWRACIKVDGKNKYIGNYDDPKIAHEAYLEHKRKSHEFCTL